MRSRLTRTIVTPVVAMSLTACTDSTGPSTQLVDMVLDFCSDQTPAFFAYRNESGGWARVTGDANGTFSFQASPHFAIAVIHQVGTSSSSEFIHTTTSEIEPFNNVACTETAGTKTLNGTVAGMPTGYSAMISMGGAFAYITAPVASYSVANLPNGPLDLIAQRESYLTATVPDKIIVRRAQNLASTIPVLDFSSAEAANVPVNTLTIGGFSANEDNYLWQDFHTGTTRNHSLASTSFFTNASQAIYGVPGTLDGDLHELNVEGDASNGTSYRGETQYYRVAGNRTATLGASLNNPTITSATPSPYVRLRVQLPSQAEYGSLISAFFEQSTSSADRIVVVTATAGYFVNTPATWQIEIPDLSSVSGFPTTAMLQSGSQASWWVDAYGGSAAGFMGKPADGTTLHYAGRSAAVNTMQPYRAARARPRGRAIVASRLALGAFR